MLSLRNRTVTLTALTGALVLSIAAASGPASGRAETSTCGSLSLESSPAVGDLPIGSEFMGVSFVSAAESWGVGNKYVAAHHAYQTLVERFNGSKWSVIPSPNQSPHDSGLNSVSMASGKGWAAGFAQEGGFTGGLGPQYHPLALRWDGARWTLASPTNFTRNAIFTGVDALTKGSAWAVGVRTTAGGVRRTLVEHASGETWTRFASPNDGATTSDNTLTGVGGTSATGLWAVGYWLSPRAGLKPVVLRYDTTRSSPAWVSVSGVPSPGKIDTVLTGIDVRTASDVWAVGYYNNGGGERPLALHWNGSRWSISRIPGVGLLRQTRAITPSNVWAAGFYYDPSVHHTKTLVVHFNGKTWTTVRSLDEPYADELIGLTADPAGSNIILVGAGGAKPLIEGASCPTGPVSLPSRKAPPAPPAPPAPGIGPPPHRPPPTPKPRAAIPVKMVDTAAAAGVSEGGADVATWSAVVADFNGDGWPDLFIGHAGGLAHLFINNRNGTFHEIDQGYFKGVDRKDCVGADFNRDGREDMFCSVGANHGTQAKSDQLFIQQPNHTFIDESYQWHVSNLLGRGRMSAVLDANNDGWPDLFVGSLTFRPDGLPSPNRFYLNTGHGSMLDSPAMGLDSDIGARCAHVVDYNGDGWPDLLICGGTDTHATHLYLYKNNNGHGFQDVSSILGAPVAANDAVMVDVNHDNRPDLITLTYTTVAERLQRANGTFAPPKTILKVHGGESLAVGDVNGDHNPDIYVVCGKAGTATNAPDYLLLGNAKGGFKTLKIPETSLGEGDRAYPIDYLHDGLTSFLVLNGRDHFKGPIQLLTPQRLSPHS